MFGATSSGVGGTLKQTMSNAATNTMSEPAPPEQAPDTLEERVAYLEEQLDAALDISKRAVRMAKAAERSCDDLEATLEDDFEAIESRLDELAERTDLISHVTDASALETEQRAAICIQTAYNDAQENASGRAFVTAREAWSSLGRSVDRTRMYDTFRKAESLVGDDDVCWFQKEPRGNDPPSRLVVDISEKRLPKQIAGITLED